MRNHHGIVPEWRAAVPAPRQILRQARHLPHLRLPHRVMDEPEREVSEEPEGGLQAGVPEAEAAQEVGAQAEVRSSSSYGPMTR